MDYDAAIVGGGPSAIFIVRGLMQDRLMRGMPTPKAVAIIEPRITLGRGTAWDENDQRMSANMTASSLQIYGRYLEGTDDFDIYNAADLFEGASDSERNSRRYPSRGTVGQRLTQEWEITEEVAKTLGIKIVHVRAVAVAATRMRTGFQLDLSDGTALRCKCMAVALGLIPQRRYPQLEGVKGYVRNGWDPQSASKTICKTDKVVILGLGPTAIDWAIRLSSYEFIHPMIALSRSGKLPAVRPKVNPRTKTTAFTRDWIANLAKSGPLLPRDIEIIIHGVLGEMKVEAGELTSLLRDSDVEPLAQLRKGLRDSVRSQPLFDALNALDELMPVIWHHAGFAARQVIRKTYGPRHRLLSFAIPPSTAAGFLALIDRKKIMVTSGGSGAISHNDDAFKIPCEDGVVVEADVLINATGSTGPISTADSGFVHDLISKGLLTADDDFGGVQINPKTGHSLSNDGQEIPGIFVSSGTLARGAIYMTNTLVGTSEYGLAVGQSLSHHLVALDNASHVTTVRRPANIVIAR